MATKISEAFVDIGVRLDKLKSGLDQVKGVVARKMKPISKMVAKGLAGGFKIAIGGIKRMLGGLLKFTVRWAKRMALAIVAGLGISIKLASDVEQTFSRLDIVMGDLAGEARAFGTALAASVGRADSAMADALGTFQSFFVGLSFSREDAFGLSKVLTRLAIDFASFNNLADAEAFERFISALSGSGEVLDRFGINIKQAALDQQLMSMGFPKVTKGATEQQKAIARLGIIYKAMGDQGALGNAADTADEFANMIKRLTGELKMLGEAIGSRLLGGGGSLIQSLIKGIRFIRDNLDPIFKWVEKWVDRIINKVADLLQMRVGEGSVFEQIQVAIYAMSQRIQLEWIRLKALFRQTVAVASFDTAEADRQRRLLNKFKLETPTGEKVVNVLLRDKIEKFRQSLVDKRPPNAPAGQGGTGLPGLAFPQIGLPGGGGGGGGGMSAASSLIQSIQTAWGSLRTAPSQEAKQLKEIKQIEKRQLDELQAMNRHGTSGGKVALI